MKESLKSLKIEMTSSDNDIQKQADDNFKNLKLEMISTVNELKKDNNDKLNSLKNEISRSKNEVDNLILLVNENKKETANNFRYLMDCDLKLLKLIEETNKLIELKSKTFG